MLFTAMYKTLEEDLKPLLPLLIFLQLYIDNTKPSVAKWDSLKD